MSSNLTIHCFVNVIFYFIFLRQFGRFMALFQKEQFPRPFYKEVSSALCFNIHRIKNACSHKYAITNDKRTTRVNLVIREYLSIWYGTKMYEDLLCWMYAFESRFLKLNFVICVLIVNICTCSVKVNGFYIHGGCCCRSGNYSKYLLIVLSALVVLK